jgi:transposase InsO family protein
MPFAETCRMEERIRMLTDYDTGNWSVSELCRRYGVCRDTFYEWRRRRELGDPSWFMDRSHAPAHCPHATAADLKKEVIELRQRFPHLGPRKLLVKLKRKAPETCWPVASTIGEILKRAGLIEPVKRRRRAIDQRRPFAAVTAANDEWAADFKGWFRTLDGKRIDPLTVTDSYSRFVIEVRATRPTIDGVRPVFEAAFRTYGLPSAIRCDNGTPFGSPGAGGLTRLSAWWLKLGIEPRFIHPASPQENGRHERMHRTLQEQTARPPAANASAQQARFDAFRRHYNEERPHEALGQLMPGELYTPSARAMPEWAEPWYDEDHDIRRVNRNGEIKWRGERVFISEALSGELVGIVELETGDHLVRFCVLDIGLIDVHGRFSRFGPPRDDHREPLARYGAMEGALASGSLRTATPPAGTDPAARNLSTIIPVQNVDHQPG